MDKHVCIVCLQQLYVSRFFEAEVDDDVHFSGAQIKE